MDASDLSLLLETLEDNVDDLKETLALFLKSTLPESVGNLPLLDKAQLYVLITYAIESLLFSYLRLNGVNAKEHPIFRELTRVKQYFEKIQNVDIGGPRYPAVRLDKSAAGRIIRNALAGNNQYDLSRSQQQVQDKATTTLDSAALSNKRKSVHPIGNHSGTNVSVNSSSESESSAASDTSAQILGTNTKRSNKFHMKVDSTTLGNDANGLHKGSAKEQKQVKKRKKQRLPMDV